METFKFNNLLLLEDESIEQYITELRKHVNFVIFYVKMETVIAVVKTE